MSENGKPEDPWARWRAPADAPAKAAGGDEDVSSPEPAAPPRQAAAEEPAARPSGTLSVRKVIKAPVAEAKPRERAGKPAGKPYERSAGKPGGAKPFAKREEAGGRAFAKPAQSGERREGNPWGKPAGEPHPAAKPRARDNDAPRRENPWAKAAGAERPQSRPDAGAVKPAQQPTGEAPDGVRLSKVMSERGMCSRREADLWISRGWVYVDGVQISELGSRIDPSAGIAISQDAKKDQAKQVTILLHKPVGYVSGQPEPGFVPAVTLISAETQLVQSGDPEFKPWMLRGLAPAGRLDVDSTGLLVLTQDGRIAKKLIGEDSGTEKEYLVRVSGEMIEGGLKLLQHGLELDGKPLKPAWVKQLNEDQLHFILKEGKKRQIRRMCELVGLRVIGLKRVRIGRVRLGDLPMGQWRFLRADESF